MADNRRKSGASAPPSLRATIQVVLKKHAEIYWNRQTGTTHCDCDAKLADAFVHGEEILQAHQAEAIEAAVTASGTPVSGPANDQETTRA